MTMMIRFVMMVMMMIMVVVVMMMILITDFARSIDRTLKQKQKKIPAGFLTRASLDQTFGRLDIPPQPLLGAFHPAVLRWGTGAGASPFLDSKAARGGTRSPQGPRREIPMNCKTKRVFEPRSLCPLSPALQIFLGHVVRSVQCTRSHLAGGRKGGGGGGQMCSSPPRLFPTNTLKKHHRPFKPHSKLVP